MVANQGLPVVWFISCHMLPFRTAGFPKGFTNHVKRNTVNAVFMNAVFMNAVFKRKETCRATDGNNGGNNLFPLGIFFPASLSKLQS